MTIHRHVRNVVLTCIGASLLALQVSAGTLPSPAHKLAVVASHHSTARHLSQRRLSPKGLNAKRLVAVLPASAGLAPRLRIAWDLSPDRAPADPVRRCGIRPARAPPLS